MLSHCNIKLQIPRFQESVNDTFNCHTSPNFSNRIITTSTKNPLQTLRICRNSFIVSCSNKDDEILSPLSASDVLGVSPDCSSAELKAAFRTKVKQFHPDVTEDKTSSDTMIRRVIRAYEEMVPLCSKVVDFLRPTFKESLWFWEFGQILSNTTKSEIIERECLDPFDEPECEALDIFVNEVFCIGKGCPYPCVKRAPQAFAFSPSSGAARATSQGHGNDYQVQTAASQCPSNCIHYVTPSQRVILEELLDSIIDVPYDTSAEKELLYSLILKAKFENNRYRKPKKQAKSSTKHVDWF